MTMLSLRERPVLNHRAFSSLQMPEQVEAKASFFDLPQGVTLPADVISCLLEAEKVISDQKEKIEHLEKLALTDELTGLWNRRGFTGAFRRELALAKRSKNSGGLLILLDLDGFKQINDVWGHAVGDLYLQTVSTVLMREVRTSDVVSRLGGDEFAILMPRLSAKAGRARAERLEKAFHERVLYWEDQVLPLRASFGSAFYTEGDASDTVFSAADLMLYAQKTGKKK